MSDKSTPSSTPSNNGHTVQKKKSFRNRKKSNSNLKVKPLEQLDGKKENTDKIPKNQVNKENIDNKKPEVEKKEVDKKKNRYHKKKSINNMKKDESKTETVNDAKSDVASNASEKQDLKKSASKQYLNQKKKRKSKMNLKAEKAEKAEEEQPQPTQPEEDNSDDELITHLTYLSMKRVEMEKEEEEQHLNNPQPQTQAHKYPKKQAYKPYTKANKRKKELPTYDENIIRRVLDCYDFPEAYLTSTFFEIFKDFKDNFQINWINEHRALLIFDNEENATKAYLQKRNESEFNIKPYENPIKEYSEYSENESGEDQDQDQGYEQEENQISKQPKKYEKEVKYPPHETHKTIQTNSKITHISNETQEKPVRRQRPVTSDAVARRLIANALGVKPKEKTEEEKEIDRKKFEEARAKKLAERLERQKRLQENSDIFNE